MTFSGLRMIRSPVRDRGAMSAGCPSWLLAFELGEQQRAHHAGTDVEGGVVSHVVRAVWRAHGAALGIGYAEPEHDSRCDRLEVTEVLAEAWHDGRGDPPHDVTVRAAPCHARCGGRFASSSPGSRLRRLSGAPLRNRRGS